METHPGFMFYSNDDVHWWFHRKHHSRVWKKRNSQQYHNNILYRYKLIKCHSIFIHPNNFCVKFDTLLTNCKYWEFFHVQITVGLHLGAQAIYLFEDRRKLYLKVHFAFHWYLELLRTQDSGRPKNLPFFTWTKVTFKYTFKINLMCVKCGSVAITMLQVYINLIILPGGIQK